MRPLATLAIALALVAGCQPVGDPGGPVPASDPPTLVLDTASSGFFDTPWPSEARLLGSAPDVRNFPNPGGADFLEEGRRLILSDVEGFSPTGAIYFRFDAPVGTVSADPLDRVGPASPIALVDIDPASPEFGRRHPCHVAISAESRFKPANLVQILPVPGLGLLEGTLYAAIVLRDLGHPGGGRLGRNAHLVEMLAGRTPAIADGARWAATYRPLVAALPALAIDADDIAAATVFRTGSPTDRFFGQVQHVAAGPALAPTGPLVLRDDYTGYRALVGQWAPPEYQEGVSPFIGEGGRMKVDGAGNPVKVRDGQAPFALAVPKGKMPADGFPLLFYIHGTGGVSTQVLDRGPTTAPGQPPVPGSGPSAWVAEKGWASCSTALPLAPEREGILSVDGYIPYNFFNPVAMRDNFFAMLLDLVHFRKMILDLSIDPRLCPGTDASAAADNRIRFDPQHVVVMGQSLGSYLAGMLSATLGGFEGAILTGAGGSWVEFPFGPTDPIDLHIVLEFLVDPGRAEPLDRFHPVIMFFDLALGPADNTQYVPYILRRPRVGPPPHVLVVEGFDDHQVPTDLQRALVLASGVDMAGTDPGPVADEQVAPVLPWGGQRVLPYPVQGNLPVPGHGPRTAVMVRYMMDRLTMEGHFVVYQIPEARRQVAAFCETLVTQGVPTVPDGKP